MKENMKNNSIIVYASKSQGGVYFASINLQKLLSPYSKFLHPIDHGYIIFIKELFLQLRKKEVFILMHFNAILLGLFLRIFKANYINVIHTDIVSFYEKSNFLKKLILIFFIFLIKNDENVFVSEEAALKAKERFKLTNTKSIPNFSLEEKNIPPKDKSKSFTLGIVSRLDKPKNIDFAINIFYLASLSQESIYLRIFGDGPEKENLISYVKKLGIEDKVFFHGFVKNKQEIYSSIDALVSFSELEGFPLTLVESISNKIPVFHTDCSSGPREIISPKSNPCIKTKSIEKTSIGFLVKNIEKNIKNNNKKSHEVNDEHLNYSKYLLDFIRLTKSESFDFSEVNKKFTTESIKEQWRVLLSS